MWTTRKRILRIKRIMLKFQRIITRKECLANLTLTGDTESKGTVGKRIIFLKILKNRAE